MKIDRKQYEKRVKDIELIKLSLPTEFCLGILQDKNWVETTTFTYYHQLVDLLVLKGADLPKGAGQMVGRHLLACLLLHKDFIKRFNIYLFDKPIYFYEDIKRKS
jgi:hypothetical protein